MRIQRVACEIQYRLAYLSTLGGTLRVKNLNTCLLGFFIGAYHLCNHPKVALDIAIKQEFVGRVLGSTSGTA